MYDILFAFVTSFCLTFLAIPSIIAIALKKNLVDVPDERRAHTEITPSLGGIAIFAGTLFSIILWTSSDFGKLQYILCSFIIIFLIGAKDDIDPISPKAKFLGELFAASILVFRADVRISSFYGVFGIGELPYIVSVLVSIFVIIAIINALNLIDGINGLSGGIGSLLSLLLGLWFYKVGHPELAMVAFSLMGALIAFLYYNITPAKIFMGDTGALLLGLVASILVIKFMELHLDPTLDPKYVCNSPVGMAIALLIIPLFDTARAFTVRMMKGKSPFFPDKIHLHHMLLRCGLSHSRASLTLVLTNIAFIVLAYFLQPLGDLPIIAIILVLAIALSYFLFKQSRKTSVKEA